MKPAGERRAAWLLLSPALGAILLFFALPLVAALFLSLTDFDIYAVADLHNARFVGLGNYLRLLRDPLFWKVLRNTVVFVVILLAFAIAIVPSLPYVLLYVPLRLSWRSRDSAQAGTSL